MEILFVASGVLNIVGGIVILFLLKQLKNNLPPF
jgi:hypothetical protein